MANMLTHTQKLPPLTWPKQRIVELRDPLPPLIDGEIQLWRFHVDDFAPWLAPLSTLLSAAEQQRAARFRALELRQRFVLSHSLLRVLLSSYTGIAPKRMVIEREAGGKLVIAVPGCDIHFNVSYAGPVVLIGFAHGRQIGIDIESGAPPSVERIARHYLPVYEVELLRQMPTSLARNRFSVMWSRMEACAKATGAGVASTLGHRASSGNERSPWCRVAGHSADIDSPVVRSFRIGPGVSCAVAAFGANWCVKPMRLLPNRSDYERLVCTVVHDTGYELI